MNKTASVRFKMPTEAASVHVKMIVKGEATPTKKVLIPKSLALLKKTCDQIFKPEKTIQSFKSEDGVQIDSVKDIVPNSTIIASVRPSKQSQKESSGISFKDVERTKFIGSPNISDATSTMSMQRHEKTVSFDIDQKSVSQSNMSRHKSQSVLGDNSSVISRPKSAQSSRMNDQSVFDESQMARSTISKMRFSAEPTNIKQTLNTFIPEEKSLSSLDYMINKSQDKDMLLSLLPLEDAQRRAWIRSLTSQPVLANITKGVDTYEETKRYAETFLEDHRFISGKWVSHRFKMAVVGPRRSGKSVLLAELATQLIVEMAYTGEWKSTMVFSFDFLELDTLVNDYKAFLAYMVDTVVSQVISQKPHLNAAMKGLAKKLKSITELDPPTPSISEKTEFDDIIMNLSKAWNNPSGLEQFFSDIIMLPINVSRVVGISNIVMVIDNLEGGDAHVSPQEPFTEFPNYIFVSEFLKFMLDNCNFIVACKDTDNFFNFMLETMNDCVDLMHDITIISTMDVAEVDEEDLQTRYMVHVEGEDLGLPLHVMLCGGVVHYLHMWDKLTMLMNNWMKSGGEKNDDFLNVIIEAHDFVNIVYKSDEDDEIRISNIVKMPVSEENF